MIAVACYQLSCVPRPRSARGLVPLSSLPPWAHVAAAAGHCACLTLQTLAVAVHNHYKRVKHESLRRKRVSEASQAARSAKALRQVRAAHCQPLSSSQATGLSLISDCQRASCPMLGFCRMSSCI